MTDTVESVLAEMWEFLPYTYKDGMQVWPLSDRLAAAHEREVGELRERIKELEQEVEQLGYDLQEEYPDD